MVDQLVSWQPGKRGKQLKMDAVMALWFCEIVARETLYQATGINHFMHNEFASQNDIEARYVINLDELAATQQFVRL
jgi:hypothetical protein